MLSLLNHKEYAGTSKEEVIRLVKEEGFAVFKCRTHVDLGGGEGVSYYGTVICPHDKDPKKLFAVMVNSESDFDSSFGISFRVYVDKEYGVNEIDEAFKNYEIDMDDLFSFIHSDDVDE